MAEEWGEWRHYMRLSLWQVSCQGIDNVRPKRFVLSTHQLSLCFARYDRARTSKEYSEITMAATKATTAMAVNAKTCQAGGHLSTWR
jgi:hypothetical protein